MKTNLLIKLFVVSVFLLLSEFAEAATVKIIVIDRDTKEELPFVPVVLKGEKEQIIASTSFEKELVIDVKEKGSYEITVKCMGYEGVTKRVEVKGKVQKIEIALKPEIVMISCFEFVVDRVPLYDYCCIKCCKGGSRCEFNYSRSCCGCYGEWIEEETTEEAVPEEIKFTSVKVYPNPSFGIITVSTEGITVDYVALYDAAGRKLNIEIGFSGDYDLSSLPPGTYLLNVRAGEKSFTERIVKL